MIQTVFDGYWARLMTKLEHIDDRYWEVSFFGLIFLYTVLLVVEALGYSSDPRLFPVLIGVPLLGLLVLKGVILLLGDRFDASGGGLFDDELEEISKGSFDESATVGRARYQREIGMVVWLISLVLLIWLLGFQLSLLVFVFAFTLVYERDVLRALVTTAVTWGLVYTVFIKLLSVTLWEGVIVPEAILELLPG